MSNIYNEILQSKAKNEKLLAILLDPEKINLDTVTQLIQKIHQSPATHIFIGGSLVENNIINELIDKIREISFLLELKALPIVLFPGNPSQISKNADGILFLMLISGRTPDYLIEHQVKAAPILKKTKLEIISTGYILIETGSKTAVERVSKTQPLDPANLDLILATAQAGEMLGNKLIYLEAGSGARKPVSKEIIENISQNIKVPLIVGGGIVDLHGIQKAYAYGADMVVIGTAFENNINFFQTK